MKYPAPGENMHAFFCEGIVEQAHEAIILADRDGLIRLWNRGAEALFGLGATEAVGQNLDIIIPERFRPAHQAGYSKAIATGVLRLEGRVLTTRSHRKDGTTLYVDLSFGLVKDEAGKVAGVFAVGRDCTERHLKSVAAAAAAKH